MPEPAAEFLTLTVSIVSYDTELPELRALLESLFIALGTLPAAGMQVKTRLLLVDNNEETRLQHVDFRDYQQRFATRRASLNVLSGHGNVGYGRGHNQVILSHQDDFHLVLNPDVVLAPDSLVVGLLYLEQNADVAVVSPSACDADGSKQYLCKRLPSLLTLLVRGFFPTWLKKLFRRHLATYEMHDLPENRASDQVPLISGCCMLCRGAVLREVGGFDESYFLYFEDFDLSLRLGERARVVYLPGMKIQHFGGNAAGKGLRHIILYARSAWRFYNTWGWRVIR
ncbi:MAG: glycosyltransferase [Pseudomonadales bacterium]|nr:glycosyltransferase [Pseudomonadales bacterium]